VLSLLTATCTTEVWSRPLDRVNPPVKKGSGGLTRQCLKAGRGAKSLSYVEITSFVAFQKVNESREKGTVGGV